MAKPLIYYIDFIVVFVRCSLDVIVSHLHTNISIIWFIQIEVEFPHAKHHYSNGMNSSTLCYSIMCGTWYIYTCIFCTAQYSYVIAIAVVAATRNRILHNLLKAQILPPFSICICRLNEFLSLFGYSNLFTKMRAIRF